MLHTKEEELQQALTASEEGNGTPLVINHASWHVIRKYQLSIRIETPHGVGFLYFQQVVMCARAEHDTKQGLPPARHVWLSNGEAGKQIEEGVEVC